ncbi:glycosyltransferase family 4 protein [Candidatus Nitrosocosmicus arcticus]|uniref:Glycosyl transferase, family 1 n=1 Tax=Candidatus Nitrosocosmicus arcticus TaxID=2035267 RepID=A0A557SYN5_9ARCH|nr:glycosyltransferase family 4 protein [Candidatus Nitrosocosmicus arcticus]TVP41712.1 Glycosyl transferase, family 1 [Candidatus Nitrosocosmicus arcticus]
MDQKKTICQKELKILHVTPFFPPSIGGIANLVYNLCNALKFDNNIHIITARNKNIRNSDRHNESIPRELTEIKSIYFPGWPYSTLRNFSVPLDLGIKINSIIKHGHFDIIHVHGHHYPISWIAIRSAYRYKIPTVLSLHGTYALNPKALGGRSLIEDLFNKYIFRKILSKCNVVIGGTKQIIEYAEKYSTPYNKFRIVPNGVNTHNYITNLTKKKEYRSKFNIHQDKVVILFLGRFDESKGALDFANAAKLLLKQVKNKIEVVMVGKGELESEIRACLKGMTNIKIIEWQSADKIHEIYIASDIYVLPSKFEGLPLTIIEAMTANLHIVYSNVGGVRDILQGYSKKSMLTHATPEEISKTLVDLCKDGSLKEIDNLSTTYVQTFDWSKIAGDLSLIYKELKLMK